MTIRLKTKQLFEQARSEGRLRFMHDAAKRGGGSYRTVHTLATDGEDHTRINLDTLEAYMINGLGFTRAELREMKFGQVFDVTGD